MGLHEQQLLLRLTASSLFAATAPPGPTLAFRTRQSAGISSVSFQIDSLFSYQQKAGLIDRGVSRVLSPVADVGSCVRGKQGNRCSTDTLVASDDSDNDSQ